MIIYVESNFVLELAFLQEEHESCDTLLDMAEAHRIDLVLPAFSIGEPYERLARRVQRRDQLLHELRDEIRELSRSKPYKESPNELQKLTNLLLRSVEEEKRRLDDALKRILNAAEIIPVGLHTIRAAIAFQGSRSLK